MRSIFRPTTGQDLPRLVSFLARSFSAQPDCDFLRPDLLHWKLWAPREDYSGPRSYVLERDGEIVAHSGVWPMQLQTEKGTLQGCHMLDWASDAKVLGAGVSILRKLSETFDFLCANGGSDMTRRIIPSIGFEKIGEAWRAKRPLRPVRLALACRPLDWKTPARLARNAVGSMLQTNGSIEGWTLRQDLGEWEGASLTASNRAHSKRSKGFFKYLEKCPTAKIRVFEMMRKGAPVGRIVLSLVRHELRIAGVWLDDPSPEARRAALALSVREARHMAPAFEVTSMGSTLESESAASKTGLRVWERTPVLWLSGRSAVPPMAFEFQMTDNDSIYLA